MPTLPAFTHVPESKKYHQYLLAEIHPFYFTVYNKPMKLENHAAAGKKRLAGRKNIFLKTPKTLFQIKNKRHRYN